MFSFDARRSGVSLCASRRGASGWPRGKTSSFAPPATARRRRPGSERETKGSVAGRVFGSRLPLLLEFSMCFESLQPAGLVRVSMFEHSSSTVRSSEKKKKHNTDYAAHRAAKCPPSNSNCAKAYNSTLERITAWRRLLEALCQQTCPTGIGSPPN